MNNLDNGNVCSCCSSTGTRFCKIEQKWYCKQHWIMSDTAMKQRIKDINSGHVQKVGKLAKRRSDD